MSPTLVMCAGFPCQDLSIAGRGAGLTGPQSGLLYDLLGLLSKTYNTHGDDGCPNCGAISDDSGTPVCQYRCPPLKLAPRISAEGVLLLPTPTAVSYGSSRGGGAGRVGKWRQSLDGLGLTHPEYREWMMGLPIGWTETELLETQ